MLRSVVILLIAAGYVAVGRRARGTKNLVRDQLAALQDSEQRFARIFQESPVGIALSEPDTHRIVETNPAFCRMLGLEAPDIVGRTIVDLAHINDRALLREAVDGGPVTDRGVEVRYITRIGGVAWASVRLTQLSELHGRPGQLLALIEDITREKRVEAELRQAQRMEATGQLTGGIAHDFNNLLGVIIGNVEFLIDALHDNPEHAGLAQEILTSALSGADLTRRLLAFARRQPLQPRQLDLNAYLPNHIAIVRRLLGETIRVTANLAPNLWPIRVDPSQVGDALLNLAINARDAMPHGGRIAIETANTHLDADQQDVEVKSGNYVMLAVTDTGKGMQPEVQERAMEPFFTTKGPGEGSGLGLSMIFGFVKQSGGHMRIDSEPGSGTTVRLFFPQVQFVDPDSPSGDVTPLATGTETILLVDDNAEMRAVARRHLTSLGYQVKEAASGPAALAVLGDGGAFDLLFTDVVMPEGMTGYQLAAAAHHLRPSLKVLLTSGFAPQDPAAEAPPWLMIRKPYRKHDLAAMVRAALEA